MALANAIRRLSSRVIPLAAIARPSAGTSRYFHLCRTVPLLSALNNASLQRLFPSISHHYSTKPTSDDSLIRVIESEIQCAVESQDEEQAEEVPDDFPFKIEDNPGQQTVTLTGEYQGESIVVEVHMPSLITGEENDNDDNDEDGEERGSQPSLPIVVRVMKNNGPFLEFGCTAYPDEVTIDSLSVKNPDDSEEQIAYEGPDFADLDENLQRAFHKYLAIRGIKPSTTNFLHTYMVDKDSREYITWLKNVKEFVQH